MRFSLSLLVRAVVLLGIVTQIVAIGVGRGVEPNRAGRVWQPATVEIRYAPINGRLVNPLQPEPCSVDRDSGQLVPLRSGPRETIDHVSVSRWTDEQGKRLAIGRWTSKMGEPGSHRLEEYGLARLAWPSGEPIDRFTTEILPASPPCWVPGDCGRIVFTAGDGQLYSLRLPEGAAAAELSETRPVKPRPIAWQADEPGAGRPFLLDPTWTELPLLNGRIIVSLSHLVQVDGEVKYLNSRLWWLRLDRFGTAIVEAGRLQDSDDTAPLTNDVAERCPTLAVDSDGSMMIAYLTRGARQMYWDLRLAPLEVDAQTGFPRMRREQSALIARGCVPTAPVFSTDAQRITFVEAIPGNLNGEIKTRSIQKSALAHR